MHLCHAIIPIDMYKSEDMLFNSHYSAENCCSLLSSHLSEIGRSFSVLCIGCDNILSDCLGPLCGTYISEACGIPVFGTLSKPVDANNLSFFLDRIRYFYPDEPLITIDSMKSTCGGFGNIMLINGGVLPAAERKLFSCKAGDYSIAGITKSETDFSVQKQASLSQIDEMASTIAKAVQFAVYGIKY